MPITRDLNDSHRIRILDIFPLCTKVAITFKIDGVNQNSRFGNYSLDVSTTEDMTTGLIKQFQINDYSSNFDTGGDQFIRTVLVNGLTAGAAYDLYLKFTNNSSVVKHITFTTLATPYQIPNLQVYLTDRLTDYNGDTDYSYSFKWDLATPEWKRLSRFMFLDDVVFKTQFRNESYGINWSCATHYRGLIYGTFIQQRYPDIKYIISSIDTDNFLPTAEVNVAQILQTISTEENDKFAIGYSEYSGNNVVLMDNREHTLRLLEVTKKELDYYQASPLRAFYDNFPLKDNFVRDAINNSSVYVATDIGGFYTIDSGLTWKLDSIVFGMPVKKIIVLKELSIILYLFNTNHGSNVFIGGGRQTYGFINANIGYEQNIPGNILDIQVLPGYSASSPRLQVMVDSYGTGTPDKMYILTWDWNNTCFGIKYMLDLNELSVDKGSEMFGSSLFYTPITDAAKLKLIQKVFTVPQDFGSDESFNTHDFMAFIGNTNVFNFVYDSFSESITSNNFVLGSPSSIATGSHESVTMERQLNSIDTFIVSCPGRVMKFKYGAASSSGRGSYEIN